MILCKAQRHYDDHKNRRTQCQYTASFRLLSKSLSPLPVVKEQELEDGTTVEYGEFKDVETRYRQRYADLAVNKNVRDIFVKRAQNHQSIARLP